MESSSVQKHERQRHKAKAAEYISILSFLSGILAGQYLLNGKMEHSRFNLVFDEHHNLIFGMLYSGPLIHSFKIILERQKSESWSKNSHNLKIYCTELISVQ